MYALCAPPRTVVVLRDEKEPKILLSDSVRFLADLFRFILAGFGFFSISNCARTVYFTAAQFWQ